MAMWSECRRLGVRFLFDETVDAIDGDAAGMRLRTGATRITAAHAVNAAGPRAAGVAALAGDELPVVAFRRNLACTEAAQGGPTSMPMCVDADTGVLVRREGGGYLVGWADPGDAPCEETQLDPRFLPALSERVGNRFPFLESIAVDERKCWAGLYPETPDHTAIIDAAPSSPRLLHCAGFGGHGIMHSLAAGRAITELIRDGRCATFDLQPLRLSRFAEGGLTLETAVL
jgi:sarcosine oxidase subunit beta